ncbi:hypothetical protein [Spongiimicrobium sp. 2-473A-2-J]|uniref:hypothetical protein n=1 Tax=Eudoraea algarum TaxID=3417568 RepID=UPI003D367052
MKTTIPNYISLFLVVLLTAWGTRAQEANFSCQNLVYGHLGQLLGEWSVQTKDRTSPGNYETNQGKSKITDLISGCGIKESFRGTYRGKDYAREVLIIGKDSTGVQMSILDSEHNSFSILDGEISDGKVVVYWYRNKEVKRLQSRYLLTVQSAKRFEFSSYLSTDYGENWALTHERIYTRIE